MRPQGELRNSHDRPHNLTDFSLVAHGALRARIAAPAGRRRKAAAWTGQDRAGEMPRASLKGGVSSLDVDLPRLGMDSIAPKRTGE